MEHNAINIRITVQCDVALETCSTHNFQIRNATKQTVWYFLYVFFKHTVWW